MNNKRINPNNGFFAIRSLALRLIESAETGKHFMVNKNALFSRARKLAKASGVIVKYDNKTADYFSVKMV